MNEEPISDQPITLVMVHGVGDTKRGAILAGFCDALQKLNLNRAFRVENWMLGKFLYARLAGNGMRFGGREIKEMIEVNWADVLRPGEGKVSILRHLVMLFFALRNLSLAEDANPSDFARLCARVYWFLIERVCLWVSLCTLGVMLLVSSGTNGLKAFGVAFGVAAALGGIAGLGILTKRPRYRCGFWWAAGFLALGVGYALSRGAWRGGLVIASANAYVASQVVWGVFLNVAFYSAVFAGGGSVSRRATRGGFLWLSLVLLTSLLVLLWLVVLASASRMPEYEFWAKSFAGNIKYDVKSAELAMVCAQLLTFVGVPLIGLLVYFSSRWRRWLRFPASPGTAAHRMVEVFLIAGPCALAAATGYIVWKYFTERVPDNADMLKIYELSALRIPALLVFLLPGIRVIVDIVGDVLFHVQPGGSEVGSRKDTKQRLELLLTELKKRETQSKAAALKASAGATISKAAAYQVVILAHSQGSIISYELLKLEPSFAEVLVTVGSPLTTLYWRFFGGDYTDPYSLVGLKWHNLYRDGDYVGGAIEGCPDNRDIGPGGHTGYWDDPVFAEQFSQCLMSPDLTGQ